MSNLINKILLESKQVGELYHYTSFTSLYSILKQNKLTPHYVELKNSWVSGVSTTRNKNIGIDNKTFANGIGDFIYTYGASIRINLDGNKISNKYKIIPYRDKDAMTNEYEQLIITKKDGLINLKNYIDSITIIPENETNQKEAKKIKILIRYIKLHKIPIEINDMWKDYIENEEYLLESELEDDFDLNPIFQPSPNQLEKYKQELERRRKELEPFVKKIELGLEKINKAFENKEWESEEEKLFLKLFYKSKVKLILKKNLNYISIIKDDRKIAYQDLKNKWFRIDYRSIWIVFENKFHWSYYETQSFMKIMLNKYFKLKDYTPVYF